jgi:hypothetical protein
MFNLRELRNLMTEALRIASDLDQDAPPELHSGLEHMRDVLDCALERIDGTMGPNRVWPDLAARA